MSEVEEIERYFKEVMGVGDGSITKAFNDSVSADDTSNMFTLAYQWQDKKHKHVRDLCSYVDALKKEHSKFMFESNRYKSQFYLASKAYEDVKKELAQVRKELLEVEDRGFEKGKELTQKSFDEIFKHHKKELAQVKGEFKTVLTDVMEEFKELDDLDGISVDNSVWNAVAVKLKELEK